MPHLKAQTQSPSLRLWLSAAFFSLANGNQNNTINDVIIGIIFFGTWLYVQEISQKSSKADSTTIVFLSTRTVRGYKSVKEMVKPESDTPWGNQIGLLHVSIPKFTNLKSSNPLEFVSTQNNQEEEKLFICILHWLPIVNYEETKRP
ncbi:hypothetical protein CFP56_041701 [Quercus suber]|uniref:Uncharacterized protein n=1 Tax=Quercus suber TaxID=58331 RepID=A0AAW0LJP7_QUESU